MPDRAALKSRELVLLFYSPLINYPADCPRIFSWFSLPVILGIFPWFYLTHCSSSPVFHIYCVLGSLV